MRLYLQICNHQENLFPQFRCVLHSHIPDYLQINFWIVVNQDVPESGNLPFPFMLHLLQLLLHFLMRGRGNALNSILRRQVQFFLGGWNLSIHVSQRGCHMLSIHRGRCRASQYHCFLCLLLLQRNRKAAGSLCRNVLADKVFFYKSFENFLTDRHRGNFLFSSIIGFSIL